MPGEIEKPLEEGGRYEAKLAWFERMLSRFEKRQLHSDQSEGRIGGARAEAEEPDGKGVGRRMEYARRGDMGNDLRLKRSSLNGRHWGLFGRLSDKGREWVGETSADDAFLVIK